MDNIIQKLAKLLLIISIFLLSAAMADPPAEEEPEPQDPPAVEEPAPKEPPQEEPAPEDPAPADPPATEEPAPEQPPVTEEPPKPVNPKPTPPAPIVLEESVKYPNDFNSDNGRDKLVRPSPYETGRDCKDPARPCNYDDFNQPTLKTVENSTPLYYIFKAQAPKDKCTSENCDNFNYAVIIKHENKSLLELINKTNRPDDCFDGIKEKKRERTLSLMHYQNVKSSNDINKIESFIKDNTDDLKEEIIQNSKYFNFVLNQNAESLTLGKYEIYGKFLAHTGSSSNCEITSADMSPDGWSKIGEFGIDAKMCPAFNDDENNVKWTETTGGQFAEVGKNGNACYNGYQKKQSNVSLECQPDGTWKGTGSGASFVATTENNSYCHKPCERGGAGFALWNEQTEIGTYSLEPILNACGTYAPHPVRSYVSTPATAGTIKGTYFTTKVSYQIINYPSKGSNRFGPIRQVRYEPDGFYQTGNACTKDGCQGGGGGRFFDHDCYGGFGCKSPSEGLSKAGLPTDSPGPRRKNSSNITRYCSKDGWRSPNRSCSLVTCSSDNDSATNTSWHSVVANTTSALIEPIPSNKNSQDGQGWCQDGHDASYDSGSRIITRRCNENGQWEAVKGGNCVSSIKSVTARMNCLSLYDYYSKPSTYSGHTRSFMSKGFTTQQIRDLNLKVTKSSYDVRRTKSSINAKNPAYSTLPGGQSWSCYGRIIENSLEKCTVYCCRPSSSSTGIVMSDSVECTDK